MSYQFTDKQEAEYLQIKGNACPVCDNVALRGGPIQVSGGQAWQDIECTDCGTEWRDLYTLTGVEKL